MKAKVMNRECVLTHSLYHYGCCSRKSGTETTFVGSTSRTRLQNQATKTEVCHATNPAQTEQPRKGGHNQRLRSRRPKVSLYLFDNLHNQARFGPPAAGQRSYRLGGTEIPMTWTQLDIRDQAWKSLILYPLPNHPNHTQLRATYTAHPPPTHTTITRASMLIILHKWHASSSHPDASTHISRHASQTTGSTTSY